ncbi:MAG: WecB/TagA/CpsF family glycosyltransferase [Hyphomicrobiaceae bacterium]
MVLAEANSGRVEILGVPISALDGAKAVETIGGWIRDRRGKAGKSRYVCACDVFNVTRAQGDEKHMRALKGADMVVADGMPLVWVGRLRGERQLRRVPGPDLLTAVCERSVEEGWSHYFYGGAEGVAGQLAQRLAQRHEGLNVAGTACPPFRPMSPEEIERDIEHINASGADIVWVGLGCPKQEIWMLEHHERLEGRIVIGVGAAFDFHSGRVERAPVWMREHGLEWMHRLMSEPRRLWRRYLVFAPRFVALSLAETAGVIGRRAMAQLSPRS